MPFNKKTGRFERSWNFVDQREQGDEITRSDLDAMANDLADGITDAAGQTLSYVGEWNPETGIFPTSRPSGARILARDAFVCLADGAVGGATFNAGDSLVAIVPDPGQIYFGRWLRLPSVSLPEIQAYAERAEAAAAALAGLVWSDRRVAITIAGQQTYDLGFDRGSDTLVVLLNGQGLECGHDYTLTATTITLIAPVVQGGGRLLYSHSADLPALNEAIERRLPRQSLWLALHSDWQAMVWDNRMPSGTRADQVPIFRTMLGEFAQTWGGAVEGIIHTGDVAHRARMSNGDANSVNAGLGTSYVAGDLYPYGYRQIMADLRDIGGLQEDRFFANAGNHDLSGRGLKEHQFAWTFEDFRRHYGRLHFHVLFGNVGFIFLSTESGGIGGMIPPWCVEWADRLMSDRPDVMWHLCIHHPIIGWGPTPGAAVRDAFTATGGEITITVGEYHQAIPTVLQVYLGGYPGGTLLVAGTDYTYVSVPPGEDEGAGETSTPMTQIELTAPAAPGAIYQARVVDVDGCQDTWTSERLEALLTKHADKLFAVFYGHRGTLQSATQTNILQDGRGIWHVNNNMGLPDRSNGGVHPTSRPLIYSILEWDAEDRKLTLRRWNSTAGRWLSETHPAADHTLEITYPRALDLGRAVPDYDGRQRDGSGPHVARHRIVQRDISEAVELDPAPANPAKPWIVDKVGKVITFEEIILADKALGGVQAGDRMQRVVYGPAGVSVMGDDGLSRSAWREAPYRECIREGYETLTGSDSVPRLRPFWELRDFDGNWLRLLALNIDDGTVEARALRGLQLGERYYPGATTINDVILLQRATKVPDKSFEHFRGTIWLRRGNTTTTLDTSAARIDIDHLIASDGTYATMWRDMRPVASRRYDLVYCDVAGERWLALRSTSTDEGAPLNNPTLQFHGQRDLRQTEGFTVVAAASVSNVVKVEDDAANAAAAIGFMGQRIMHGKNMVGTVTQSAGLPTGAVVETGTNANGTYTRFADGTQICWGNVTITPVANTPTAGAWTFPAAFISSTAANLAILPAQNSAVPGSQVVEVSFGNPTTTGCDLYIYRTNTTSTAVRGMAIGRWF